MKPAKDHSANDGPAISRELGDTDKRIGKQYADAAPEKHASAAKPARSHADIAWQIQKR